MTEADRRFETPISLVPSRLMTEAYLPYGQRGNGQGRQNAGGGAM